MQEVETRAQVVAIGPGSLAGRGPTAVLARSEIEEVIERGDNPARLVLEIARADGEIESPSPEARVAVDWDRAELEELLRAADGKDVMLSFDEKELMRLLEESDVEGHGLRERAAILGIVVATAGAASGSAFAHPQLSGESTTGAAPTSASAFITDSRGGDGGAVVAPAAASGFVTDSRGGDGGAVPAAEGTTGFVTDSRGGDGGLTPAPEGPSSFVTLDQAPQGPSSFVTLDPAPDDGFVTDSRGGDGGLAPAPEGTTSFITDSRGGDGGVAPVAASDTGISLPSPEDTAALAGLALLITAAGFVAVRSRRDHGDHGLPA
jgi:hypothetical protein